MKEIIYIQAGNISNYVGTHFWNAQQSYFTYSGDKEVLIDHDVSFREGVSPRVCHSSKYMLHSRVQTLQLGRADVLPKGPPI